MRTDVLVGVMDAISDALGDIDPQPWESYDRAEVLHAVHRLDISIHGFIDRIRAASVNATPVPLPPTKPAPPPSNPKPEK